MIKLFNKTTTDPAPAAAASWTRTEALKTKALRILVWALVTCGPLGLWIAATKTSPAQPPAASETAEPTGGQQAAAFAEDAVVRWLRASRGNEDSIAGIFPNTDLPNEPQQVSDPATTNTVWTRNTWTVTVAVTITTPAETDEQPGTMQRRYFQLPVSIAPDGTAAALALPAEIAGPPITQTPTTDYRTQLPTTNPLTTTTGDFLNALLTGVGDITRYTSPATTIAPITPAPYTAVNIESVHTRQDLNTPNDGDHIELLVRARAETPGTYLRLDYLLQLEMRAGRWEVIEILGAPAPEPTPEPSPSPTNS